MNSSNIYNYQNFDSIANNPDIDVVYNTQEWRALVKGQNLGEVNCAAGYRENRTDHWKQKKETGGVTADIKTSFGDYMNFITIGCEKGDIKMQPYSEYNGQNGASPLGIIHHPYQVPFQQAKQMDDDALSIIEKRPMLAPGEEGRHDIRLVEAIYKSAWSKQPVRL
ncbi:MAG: hypothetical protein JST42_18580 [Bacteroidetes bacterium]|nr:hypothetical protein [Bacteroidota bacterium]